MLKYTFRYIIHDVVKLDVIKEIFQRIRRFFNIFLSGLSFEGLYIRYSIMINSSSLYFKEINCDTIH